MPRKLFVAIAFVVCSIVPLQSAQAAVTNYHATKAAQSGRRSLLGATTNLDANCNWLGISPAKLLEPPTHGRLFVVRGSDYPEFSKDNDRYKCRFKKYPSQLLYYQSEPGYVGADRFKIQNITTYGDINYVTFDIAVQ